jgi:predicted O-methyltransferase YrrM
MREGPSVTLKSIQQIREELGKSGNHSHTSFVFQDDLIRFIHQNCSEGGSVIEVGCYRGGMTAQLAATCSTLGKRLYVVDIDQVYIDITKVNVDGIIGPNNTVYFCGDLSMFYDSGLPNERPILVFIDGDHRYSGVVKDIRAVLESKMPPCAVAFHDFSLRYRVPELADVHVDQAIYDTFGREVRFRPIGEIAGRGRILATEPQHDGHYHESGEPEGVLLFLEDLAPRH